MAGRRETKRFDFFAWMENWLYLDSLAQESGRSMATELNRIIDKHRKQNDLHHVEPASRRTQ